VNSLERALDFQAFIFEHLSDYLTNREDGDLPDFHQEWTKLISYKRLAVAAPRSFAKSAYFSIFYPLYQVLEGRSKDVLMVSAASNLAEWWLGKIKRELESNQSILADYGDQRSGIWRQDHIELKNGAVMRARGAECKIRGFRPDLVLIDDLESDEAVWSKTGRKKLKDWFLKTLTGTMDPHGQLIMIGTLLHPEALLANILKEPPEGWQTRKYKALLDDGKSIWPSKWSPKELLRRKDQIGEAAFEQEYQNNPIPEEWRTFKEEDIRYFDKEPSLCAYFTTVDPAISVDLRSDPDYTAIVTCAVDADKNIYVVDVTQKRMLPAETITEILRHNAEYNPEIIGIETVGFQKVLRFALDEECSSQNIYPFIKEISVGQMRKGFRIERLQPYFEKKKVFIKKSMTALKSELLAFPTGKHDDMIDALASQLEFVREGGTSAKNLPKDGFDYFWDDYKKRKMTAKVIGGTWGNHKLRRMNG
jgi:predicted phage terminase large subunit-like protein